MWGLFERKNKRNKSKYNPIMPIIQPCLKWHPLAECPFEKTCHVMHLQVWCEMLTSEPRFTRVFATKSQQRETTSMTRHTDMRSSSKRRSLSIHLEWSKRWTKKHSVNSSAEVSPSTGKSPNRARWSWRNPGVNEGVHPMSIETASSPPNHRRLKSNQ